MLYNFRYYSFSANDTLLLVRQRRCNDIVKITEIHLFKHQMCFCLLIAASIHLLAVIDSNRMRMRTHVNIPLFPECILK